MIRKPMFNIFTIAAGAVLVVALGVSAHAQGAHLFGSPSSGVVLHSEDSPLASPERTETPEASPSPEPTETPEPIETPEAAPAPKPAESPEAADTEQDGDDQGSGGDGSGDNHDSGGGA